MRGSCLSLVPVAVSAALVAAAITGCAGAGPQWNEGPGWRLSGSPTTIPPPPAPAEAKPESRAAVAVIAPQPATPRRPGQPLTVTVQPGDTLTGLAIRHRTSLAAIMAANNLSDPRIAPGQQLVIPGR
jgi:LysM repeat protein